MEFLSTDANAIPTFDFFLVKVMDGPSRAEVMVGFEWMGKMDTSQKYLNIVSKT